MAENSAFVMSCKCTTAGGEVVRVESGDKRSSRIDDPIGVIGQPLRCSSPPFKLTLLPKHKLPHSPDRSDIIALLRLRSLGEDENRRGLRHGGEVFEGAFGLAAGVGEFVGEAGDGFEERKGVA